jgi:hypothetical protein
MGYVRCNTNLSYELLASSRCPHESSSIASLSVLAHPGESDSFPAPLVIFLAPLPPSPLQKCPKVARPASFRERNRSHVCDTST